MNREPTPDEIREIADAIAAGNKIEAIKRYREITGRGLAESKDFIEKLTDELRAKDPARFPARKSGCTALLAIAILLALASCLALYAAWSAISSTGSESGQARQELRHDFTSRP